MDRKDVEILNIQTLYEGFFRMRRLTLKHRLFGGGWSKAMQREIFERDRCVSVVPYDPVRDHVVLIEQFRPGPLAAGDDNPWIAEIVAGIIEPGEEPADVARREALEETGCALERVFPIAAQYISPGGSTEFMHIFCGIVDSKEAGGVHGLKTEGEDIRVFTESLDKALQRIADGGLRSTFSAFAVQWVALNREKLR